VQPPLAHCTVLLNEAVQGLHVQADGCYIDATFGRGGHARAILARLSAAGRLAVYDKDPQAIAAAQQLAASDARLHAVHHQGFAALAEQPEDPTRGFSFRHDGPLDMRMDPTRGQSAAEWLATAEVTEIAEVIREYGEERFAQSIAKALDRRRQERGPIGTTAELAQIVAGAVKTRQPGKDPATRTFQAIRIFINAELEELQHALKAALRVLKPGGWLVVISFHSLEDRLVKQFMAQHAKDAYDRRQPLAAPKALALAQVQRVLPSAAEVAANPRARSAVLRLAQRSALAWEALP